LLGEVALYMHTKFEASSFSHSGDTKVITDKIMEAQTDRTDQIVVLGVGLGVGVEWVAGVGLTGQAEWLVSYKAIY